MVVGPRAALARTSVTVRPGAVFVSADRVQAKLRYRSDPVWATVRAEAGGFQLDLDDPVVGVAAGQTAVLYQDDVVVGAGRSPDWVGTFRQSDGYDDAMGI